MITLEMILNGIDQGVVKLDIDPNMTDGTVCRIGEDWFYFGGEEAADMAPDEYLANVPKEDIAREIYDVLDEFWCTPEIYEAEYQYCESYLRENLAVLQNQYRVVAFDSRLELVMETSPCGTWRETEERFLDFLKKYTGSSFDVRVQLVKGGR